MKKILEEYFASVNGYYNDEEAAEKLKISVKKFKELVTWLARLELGEKILDCVKKKGECWFEAEL